MTNTEPRLQLSVVSQEKKLVELAVESVTLPTSSGEITVLPGHIPLLSELQTGELVYRVNGEVTSIVISKGFMNMANDNTITVIVDTAVHERDVSIEKAEKAIAAAKEALLGSADQREKILAEASLILAMWEIKVAQKTKRARI